MIIPVSFVQLDPEIQHEIRDYMFDLMKSDGISMKFAFCASDSFGGYLSITDKNHDYLKASNDERYTPAP